MASGCNQIHEGDARPDGGDVQVKRSNWEVTIARNGRATEARDKLRVLGFSFVKIRSFQRAIGNLHSMSQEYIIQATQTTLIVQYQRPRAAQSHRFNLDLVQIVGGVVPNWKGGQGIVYFQTFVIRKFRGNVENHDNVNFRDKNFVIELGEITARPHVL